MPDNDTTGSSSDSTSGSSNFSSYYINYTFPESYGISQSSREMIEEQLDHERQEYMAELQRRQELQQREAQLRQVIESSSIWHEYQVMPFCRETVDENIKKCFDKNGKAIKEKIDNAIKEYGFERTINAIAKLKGITK